jgi:glutamyl-tRNA reductase
LSVVVVGVEHRHAPLDVLERVTLSDEDLGKVLGELRDRANITETVVLSTCLRTEVYAVVDRFHDAVSEIEAVLARRAGTSTDALEPYRTVRFDDDVAVHLFAVAAGLESAVVGEGEVLGQVRRAWERAQEERASGPVLAELFRHAVRTGKRVRTETAIARGTTSFAHAAIELAETRRPGGLAGTKAVVLGAGEMGAGVARALHALPVARRPASIAVWNRTAARAATVVSDLGPPVKVVRDEDLDGALAGADVVLAAVEAEGHLVPVVRIAPTGDRTGHPVLVVDLGMPRNVEPAAAAVGGVTLFDMDLLSAAVAQAMVDRQGETAPARAIVEAEVAHHREVARARGAAPVVAALRARLESVRQGELERRRGQFPALSDTEWAEVDAATKAVLQKVLHDPTVALKDAAGTARGERLVESLRTLFDL